MFSFLRRIFRGSETERARKTDAVRRIDRTLVADCEREADRTAKAHPGFMSNPRDASLRAALLQRATEAGLAEHEMVKRLAFLDRLVEAMSIDPTPAPEVLAPFVEEAKQYQFEEIQSVRLLRRHLDLERLKQEGPRVMGQDRQGRAVYYRCTAEFKNKEGQFEVRADGISFTGEVAIEIAWTDVAHVSKTTHTYRGDTDKAIAIQEGKRRTPTKFVFGIEADYACEVTLMSWARRTPLAAPAPKERPSRAARASAQAPVAEPEPVAPPEPATPPDDRVGTTIEFPSTGSFPMAVVGESRRQATLRSLGGNRLSKGETVIFTAAIVPEPKNSFDPNAVAVYVKGGGMVGYLSREDAVEYKPVTEALIAAKAVGLCRARLIGGTAGKPSIGVMLDLAEAATLLPCIAPSDAPF